MGIDEFEKFCRILVKQGIIVLLDRSIRSSIGYKPEVKDIEFLDKQYFAFGSRAQTMKQWLQINSEGKFRFNLSDPEQRFIIHINRGLIVDDEKNIHYIFSRSDSEKKIFRVLEIIQEINNKTFSITDLPYEAVSFIYKVCKIIANSQEKAILYALLKNDLSGINYSWNLINYDDRNKLIGFYDSKPKLTRFETLVESYKTEESSYSLVIFIDKVEEPNLTNLQDIIVSSKDRKKLGIILEDKSEDLFRHYIKESNKEASYEEAIFFYSMFEEGYDLDLRYLNNAAYVFIEKEEIEKAINLLYEAKRKIVRNEIEQHEFSTACLVFFNLGITSIKQNNYHRALDEFESVIKYSQEKQIDEVATVLKVLKLNSENEIETIEIKEGNPEIPRLNCKFLAEKNIATIEEFLTHYKPLV